MPRRRTLEKRDRDARALELHTRGLTYKQIAQTLNCDHRTAWDAVQRALKDRYILADDQARAIAEERCEYLIRTFAAIAARPHYVTSTTGNIVRHPDTGQPLIDDGPTIQAGLALLKAEESRRKLLGLDKPAKIEVKTIDAIDARLAYFADQMDGVDAGAKKTLSLPAGSGGEETAP